MFQSQDMMGVVMPRPHSGRIWDDTLPFCVVPRAGRDTEKEEDSRMGGGAEWLSQFTNTLPFLTVCTVLPYVFQYLITPCEMVSLVRFYRGGN